MIDDDLSGAELARRFKAAKAARVEANVALAAFAQDVGKAKDTAKRSLEDFVEPGDTIRPVIDGMDAGTINVTKGSESVYVEDNAAFIEWMLRTYPTEVVQVCREAFWSRFTVSEGGEFVIGPSDEVDPPGLAVNHGPPVIRVTAPKDPTVREVLYRRYRSGLNELLPGGPDE